MTKVEEVLFGSAGFSTASEIRRAVFVDEQGVHPDHEFDARERDAIHLLANWDGIPAGVARCYGEEGVARIGRVAVLPEHRKRGVGRALMLHALDVLRDQGYAQVVIHAQTQAAPFYAGLGFEVEGTVFEEEGIPHVTMVLDLSAPAAPTQLGLP